MIRYYLAIDVASTGFMDKFSVRFAISFFLMGFSDVQGFEFRV